MTVPMGTRRAAAATAARDALELAEVELRGDPTGSRARAVMSGWSEERARNAVVALTGFLVATWQTLETETGVPPAIWLRQAQHALAQTTGPGGALDGS